MKMPYTINPNMPKVRAKAVDMHREGYSVRAVARHFGVVPSTISKWNKKTPFGGAYEIPTESSRPKHHPNETPKEVIDLIKKLRQKTKGRCAEVIHKMLENQGIKISLSTVKRILQKHHLTKKRSPWKRYHKSSKRPFVAKTGDLIQVDTIHIMKNKSKRLYIYTLIDVHSRFVYAQAVNKISTKQSLKFVHNAMKFVPFKISCIQSDHGLEFSTHFTERLKIQHRHSRVRKPNDNAHCERFNRTIQEELIQYIPKNVKAINKALKGYLKYYNYERLHLGIDLKTPSEMV